MSSKKKLITEIEKILKDKKGIILAHNYQRDEIQEIADYVGDSFGLSKIAAESESSLIVFCGVHFMAESAAILAPEKDILLPRLDAGCPMADMITADQLRAKKKELEIPVVCYVNTSAEVKAESDICCTSANAVKVVNSVESDRVLFVPDMNLGSYVARHSDKKIILWKGFCPTHHLLKKSDVLKAKELHPEAKLVVHPECPTDILDIADHICSTTGMYSYASKSESKEFIIGTEMGVLYRLNKENPEKKFYLASQELICPNMKVTRLEDVYEALCDMKNIIKVPEEIRLPAKRALDRMLAVPRD
jgi:quinolinate synthase